MNDDKPVKPVAPQQPCCASHTHAHHTHANGCCGTAQAAPAPQSAPVEPQDDDRSRDTDAREVEPYIDPDYPALTEDSVTSRRKFLQASTGLVAATAAAAVPFAETALAQDFSSDRGRGFPKNRRILLKGGTVLTMDSAIGDFDAADVLIEGTKIKEVRPNIHAPSATAIDARGMIVMPGFIDTHRHQFQSAMRSSLTNGTAYVFPLGPQDYFLQWQSFLTNMFRPQDGYAGIMASALGQLNAGITTTCDMSQINHTPTHTDAMIQALKDAGRRSVFAYSPSDGPNSQFPQDIYRLRRQYFSSSDQLLTLAMHVPTSTSPTTNFPIARDVGAPITSHISGPIMSLYNAGLMGPDNTYIHCTSLTNDEWQAIADTGGTVSIAGPIEMSMGLGVPPWQKALDHGINPSLSSDTDINMSGDMFTQMRGCLTLQRMQVHERRIKGETNLPRLLQCRDVLKFATIEGAKTNHLDSKIGSLTPGKEADIIMLDAANAINVMPLTNAYGAVVTLMDTSNVRNVIVAGKILKWNGALVGVDLKRVQRLVTAAQDYLWSKTDWPRSVVDTSVPGH